MSKLHSPGLSRTLLCCHALDQDVMRFDIHAESHAESLADAYCLTTVIGDYSTFITSVEC